MKLYPHQERGVEFLLSRRHALLADSMGVGKSAQIVTATKGMCNILVVCPATAKVNWQREFWKFSERKAHIVRGKDQPPSNIIITNYEEITKNIAKYTSMFWDAVVFDESHYLKSVGSIRTNKLFGENGIIHKAYYVWCLSGTPAPNHAGELWVMMYTFGLTKLKYDAFVDRYCTTIPVPNKYAAKRITGTNTENISEVKAALDRFSLRRLLKDVVTDMPPISFHTTVVDSKIDPLKDYPELMAKVREEWDRINEQIEMIDGFVDDEKLLNLLTLIAPSISSLRRYHGLKKAPVVAEIIAQELADFAYGKIVIFGVHTDVMELMRQRLAPFGVAMITGKTPQGKRQGEIDRFQNDSNCRVFCGNIGAAGTAINLTAAYQVAFVERDYVPGNNAQAASRCHRIGQINPVIVRDFSLPGFDERLSMILTRKAQELAAFMV